MKILVIAPEKQPEICTIYDTLKAMQNVVGGYIEALYPWQDEVALICNDESKIDDLPLNRSIFNDDGKLIDIIAGTFFICSAPLNSGSFTDLPEGLIEHYTRILEL